MHSMNNILTLWMRISSSVNQLTNSNIAYKYNWLQKNIKFHVIIIQLPKIITL
jgi:hypothetical protein